jgi:hypothetical protein
MSEILELLFGIHLAGWKAVAQFWIWFIIATIPVILYLRKNLR